MSKRRTAAGDSNGDGGRPDRLLTAAEVAERIGTTERYVWSLGRSGVLARVRLRGGRLVRFLESDVDAMIAAGRSCEPAPTSRPAPPVKPRGATAQISMRF
jgi:excisionase family DNA binding protein